MPPRSPKIAQDGVAPRWPRIAQMAPRWLQESPNQGPAKKLLGPAECAERKVYKQSDKACDRFLYFGYGWVRDWADDDVASSTACSNNPAFSASTCQNYTAAYSNYTHRCDTMWSTTCNSCRPRHSTTTICSPTIFSSISRYYCWHRATYFSSSRSSCAV